MQGHAASTMAAARVEQGIILTGGVAHATLNFNSTNVQSSTQDDPLETHDLAQIMDQKIDEGVLCWKPWTSLHGAIGRTR